MHRARFDIHINAPAKKVWDLVQRFDRFQTWTRWVAITGDALPETRIGYAVFVRLGGKPRPFTVPAYVCSVADGRRLAWRLGFPGLRFEQAFEVVPGQRGTCLAHTLEVRGVLSGLIGRNLTSMVRRPYEGLLADAKRRLEGGPRPTAPPPPKPKTPRYLPPLRKRGRR